MQDVEPVVNSIILSDAVIREHGTQKLSLIGCFNMLGVPQVPTVYPGFWVTVGVSNIFGKTIELKLAVRIEDPTSGQAFGGGMGELKTSVQAPDGAAIPPEMARMIVDLPVPVQMVTFPKEGLYSIVILSNNEKIGERSLFVQRFQNPGPTHQA